MKKAGVIDFTLHEREQVPGVVFTDAFLECRADVKGILLAYRPQKKQPVCRNHTVNRLLQFLAAELPTHCNSETSFHLFFLNIIW